MQFILVVSFHTFLHQKLVQVYHNEATFQRHEVLKIQFLPKAESLSRPTTAKQSARRDISPGIIHVGSNTPSPTDAILDVVIRMFKHGTRSPSLETRSSRDFYGLDHRKPRKGINCLLFKMAGGKINNFIRFKSSVRIVELIVVQCNNNFYEI